MQATTLSPLTLQIIFVRWLLTIILKPLMSWTTINIQVEDYSSLQILSHTSQPPLVIGKLKFGLSSHPDLQERDRFLRVYLAASGC